SDLEGKGASVSSLVQVVGETAGSGVLRAPSETLTLTLRDGDGLEQTYTITGTNSLKELVDKVNSQTAIEASINETGKLVLTAPDAASLTVAEAGTVVSSTGLVNGHHNFSLVFNDTSANKNGVTIQLGAGADAPDHVSALGIDVQDANGNLLGSAVDVSVTPAPATLQEGDLIINGIAIGKITPQEVTGTVNAAATHADLVQVVSISGNETSVLTYPGGNGEVELSSGHS